MGYLSAPPLAIAHRGGVALPANDGIENTVQAVANAVELGFRYIETDARASSDGVAFSFHDTDFLRVAPSSGFGATPFSELTAQQIRSVKLAGGQPVATIAELLAAFPTTCFNIDVKTTTVIPPTVQAIIDNEARDRVLVASFSHARLTKVRALLPGVTTSASPREVAALRFGFGPIRALARKAGATCLQVPEVERGIRIVTPGFIRAAHDLDMQVHVWTVDAPSDINRLLDAGVDGLITDRPEVLRDVLSARGQWEPA